MKARLISCFLALGLGISTGSGSGFSEPPITFYGSVTYNYPDGYAFRITSGNLTWTIQPSGGGAPIIITTPLHAVGNSFSYRLEIPVEKIAGGFTVTPGKVAATLSNTGYTRGSITLDGMPIPITFPAGAAGGTFSFAETQRGKMERVDFAFSMGFVDTDGDGIPDWWENQYGLNPFDPNDIDSDGDGETNLSEYLSHTDPNDPNSVVHSARALNLSTRLHVSTGENVLIGGFIITGNAPKQVIVRGIGPTLAASGIANPLANPTLELFDKTGRIAFNDDWKESQQAEIEATTIPPTNDAESAIVRTLPPGNYTAILRGKGDTTGVGLVEVYDISATQPEKLANISSRGFVDAGENIIIGGFIVGNGLGNNGEGSAKLVVRALGPSLASDAITNPLSDPTLELFDSQGVSLGSNNNWREKQQAELEAIGLAPKNDLESALIVTVPKGRYTAILRGKDGATGVGLVEVYNIP